jgi:hypothetical protein
MTHVQYLRIYSIWVIQFFLSSHSFIRSSLHSTIIMNTILTAVLTWAVGQTFSLFKYYNPEDVSDAMAIVPITCTHCHGGSKITKTITITRVNLQTGAEELIQSNQTTEPCYECNRKGFYTQEQREKMYLYFLMTGVQCWGYS